MQELNFTMPLSVRDILQAAKEDSLAWDTQFNTLVSKRSEKSYPFEMFKFLFDMGYLKREIEYVPGSVDALIRVDLTPEGLLALMREASLYEKHQALKACIGDTLYTGIMRTSSYLAKKLKG